MKGLRRRVGPYWQLLRVRRPRTAERLEDLGADVRGPGSAAREVRVLRTRLAELQRDHLLLAAHVATLTERLAAASPAAAPDDAEPARQRARLAAIAAYEQRIGALEEAVARRRDEGRGSNGRTRGERSVRAS